MTRHKLALLRTLSFGRSVAELEANSLVDYFVETPQWRKIYGGEIDLVLGPKGSGKSAIYALIKHHTDDLFDKGVMLIPAERSRGTPGFKSIDRELPKTTEEFEKLWKLYFLTLIGRCFREYQIYNNAANTVINFLEQNSLLSQKGSLRTIIKNVRDYVFHLAMIKSLEPKIGIDANTGLPTSISANIIFREPSTRERADGLLSCDELLELANRALRSVDLKVWILIDRLDVAFEPNSEIEKIGLKSLMNAVKDLIPLSSIKFKVFLRDDLWNIITKDGFREATHFSDNVRLWWSRQDLLNLIAQRLVLNEGLLKHLGVDKENILRNFDEQRTMVQRLMPMGFNQLLENLADGSGRVTPRELISFFIEVCDLQIQMLERGDTDLPNELLFSLPAYATALGRVSEIVFQHTILAEFPRHREMILQLIGASGKFSTEFLAKRWGLNLREAATVANDLVDLGFFRRLRSDYPLISNYVLPPLYRRALQEKGQVPILVEKATSDRMC